MLFYCFKCRKQADSKNPNVSKTKKGKLKNLSKFAASDTSKSRFTENWKASGILSSL